MAETQHKEVLSFKIVPGGCELPAGFYRAKFTTVETTNHAEYGAGLCFVFHAIDPPYDGKKATRITAAQPTLRNAAGKLIAAISGQQLKRDDVVDLGPFRGHEYAIQIEQTDGGYTRIGAVMPATLFHKELPAPNGQPEKGGPV
jgi:hypothetical protein